MKSRYWITNRLSRGPSESSQQTPKWNFVELQTLIMITGLLLLALQGLVASASHWHRTPILRHQVHRPPPHKYTNKCFQCEYRPPKIHTYKVPIKETYEYKVPKTTYDCKEEKVFYAHRPQSYPPTRGGYGQEVHGLGYNKPTYGYERKCYPRVTYEIVQSYRTKYEARTEKTAPGGFDPCKGPIDKYSGRAAGVDDWECHSNCYTRTDKHGNIQRGCYKGEFEVNPHLLGCHWQGGYNYCFCKGDHCNGGTVH